ncbi:MAG: RraA family protein [Candidatus Adiutrix sp.]|jgi:regulator of RNase E activity RraA|nr:RraA family protein [Candidatus Adiutrix sp.]
MKTIIHPPAKPLGADIIQRLERLDPALLCDGLSGFGLPRDGCLTGAIKPLNPTMRVLGPALTVETAAGDNFPVHVATYGAPAGYVLVIDGQGCDERAYVGGLIGGAARAVGLAGIVIDGYARDRGELEELGLPVFCRGLTQRGPVKNYGGVINGSINCGGVRVDPGDVVMGNADGVTVIPGPLVADVLARAEKKMAYEQERREVIDAYRLARENGGSLPELTPDWVLDMMKRAADGPESGFGGEVRR